MVYNYVTILPFEKDVDVEPILIWMKANWWYSIVLSILYGIIIILGQQWMSNRKEFNLEKPLIAWNVLLSLINIVAFIRTTPSFVNMVSRGFTESVCAEPDRNPVAAFWTYVFAASRLYEFMDTFFIVLRKKPLSFIHCYHHSTVLVFAWRTFKDRAVIGLWFGWINCLVHAIMYPYYAIRSLGFCPPKCVPRFVTTMQTLQMITAVAISVAAYVLKYQGVPCQLPYEYVHFAFAMYISYFLLFAHLYYRSYICRKDGKLVKKSKVQ